MRVNELTAYLICGGRRMDFPALIPVENYLGTGYRSSLEVQGGRVTLEMHEQPDGEWFAGISNQGETTLELFWGFELPLPSLEGAYTLIPSVWYNGNDTEPAHEIVAWNEATGTRAEIPMSFCATPVLMHFDGASEALVLRPSPRTKAGWSGFVLDREAKTAHVVVPAYEQRRYRHACRVDRPRLPYRLEPQESLTQRIALDMLPVDSVSGLFRAYAESFRSVPRYPSASSAPVSLDDAAQRISDYFLQKHWYEGARGEKIFLNAFLESSGVKPGDESFWPDWWQLTGWCGGPMVSLAMIKRGGEYRRRGTENVDWIVETAIYPSGLPSPLYDGNAGEWLPGTQGKEDDWCYHHIRSSGDFFHYLIKCLLLERAAGHEHPAWDAAIRRGLDVLCDVFDEHGEFGFLVDIQTQPPAILESGSCGGAFVMQALAAGMAAYPEQERYRDVFRRAAAYYYESFVKRGHCTGGPLDIRRADDSESAGALADAFFLGWKTLGDAALLRFCEDATHIFLTYVVSYCAPFPAGSPLEGLNPCGGVIANVKNRHIGPGICTNSGVWLKELGEATGKQLYSAVFEDIVHAACNFVCLEDYALLGYERQAGAWYPFRKGQVSEQINLGDALNGDGEMWAVSCSWPATSVLLSWVEQDGRIC